MKNSTGMVWSNHKNDTGDHCPFSGLPVSQAQLDENGEDARCPQVCRESFPEEDEEDEDGDSRE